MCLQHYSNSVLIDKIIDSHNIVTNPPYMNFTHGCSTRVFFQTLSYHTYQQNLLRFLEESKNLKDSEKYSALYR